jgi:hypothetical protein
MAGSKILIFVSNSNSKAVELSARGPTIEGLDQPLLAPRVRKRRETKVLVSVASSISIVVELLTQGPKFEYSNPSDTKSKDKMAEKMFFSELRAALVKL